MSGWIAFVLGQTRAFLTRSVRAQDKFFLGRCFHRIPHDSSARAPARGCLPVKFGGGFTMPLTCEDQDGVIKLDKKPHCLVRSAEGLACGDLIWRFHRPSEVQSKRTYQSRCCSIGCPYVDKVRFILLFVDT